MHATPRRALPRAALLVLLVVLPLAYTSTACKPVPSSLAWRMGKTHGAIVETTAVRVSLGIYRVPTTVLVQIEREHGVRAAQDAMWAFGRPPQLKVSATIKGHRYTITLSTATKKLRQVTHDLIYGDSRDLRSAIRDAGSHGDCLAVTLLSYGVPDSNWTHKRVGCRDGSLR